MIFAVWLVFLCITSQVSGSSETVSYESPNRLETTVKNLTVVFSFDDDSRSLEAFRAVNPLKGYPDFFENQLFNAAKKSYQLGKLYECIEYFHMLENQYTGWMPLKDLQCLLVFFEEVGAERIVSKLLQSILCHYEDKLEDGEQASLRAKLKTLNYKYDSKANPEKSILKQQECPN